MSDSIKSIKLFQILCGTAFEWKVTPSGQIPEEAIIVSYESNGEPLYIGRAHFENSLVPGRIHRSGDSMYIAFGGAEHVVRQYEVLVKQSTSTFTLFFQSKRSKWTNSAL